MATSIQFYWLHYDSRSGSTFLAQKLSTQYRVYSPPEVNFVPKILKLVSKQGFGDKSKLRLRDIVLSDVKHNDWLLNADNIMPLLEPLTQNSSPAQLLRQLLSPLLDEIGEVPQGIMFKKKAIAIIPFLDEMLHGIQHVVLIRDGRAVMHSKMNSKKSTTNLPFTRSVLTAAKKWKRFLQHYEKVQHQENVVLVRYEDLILNESELSNIASRLACEKRPTDENGKYVLPARYAYGLHANIDKPADPSRLDSWKRQGNTDFFSLYDLLNKRELKRYGYTVVKTNLLNYRHLFADVWRILDERVRGEIFKRKVHKKTSPLEKTTKSRNS